LLFQKAIHLSKRKVRQANQFILHRLDKEATQKLTSPGFSDPYLDEIRIREWRRRMFGIWFYNEGEPTYITGQHYMLLNYWKFQGKWFDYREPNRDYYYVLQYCIEDENCLGLVEITKRKEGKTARAGLFLYEYISRTSLQNITVSCRSSIECFFNFPASSLTYLCNSGPS